MNIITLRAVEDYQSHKDAWDVLSSETFLLVYGRRASTIKINGYYDHHRDMDKWINRRSYTIIRGYLSANNKLEKSYFYTALDSYNIRIIKMFLDKFGKDIVIGEESSYYLRDLIVYDRTEVLECLLKGAKLDDFVINSMISFALLKKRPDMAIMFIKTGTNLYTNSLKGYNVLPEILMSDNCKLIEETVKNKSIPDYEKQIEVVYEIIITYNIKLSVDVINMFIVNDVLVDSIETFLSIR